DRCRADVGGPFINEVLINLVGNDKKIVFDGQSGNRLDLSSAKDLSARISRTIDHNRFGFWLDGRPQTVKIDLPGAEFHRDQHRLYPQRLQGTDVVSIKRLEEDNLIA